MTPLPDTSPTQQELASFLQIIGPFKADALTWMRDPRNGWLSLDQTEEHLSGLRIRRVIAKPKEFRAAVFKLLHPEQEAEGQRQEERDRLLEKREEEFWQMVPAAYEVLSNDDAPRPEQYRQAREFLVSEQCSGKLCGLYMFGTTGSGKTAAAWAALERFWEERPEDNALFVKSVRLVMLAKAKHLSGEAREEFEELLQQCLRVPFLILDDIGTERYSPGAEEALFLLLDTRTERRRRTIITSNDGLHTLSAKFPNNAAKIARRIREHLLPINFDREQPANVKPMPKEQSA
jgi:DNA replication protein DnaC